MVFESYFRRLSYLHAGVRFSMNLHGENREFFAEHGIRDLFTAISSPYQVLHEPIYLTASEGKLELKLVMAYQSWSDHHLWCFINYGRAVEGGTHQKGLLHALKQLKKKLDLPERFNNGVVAVMWLRYPEVHWEGCIKAKIANPELKAMVSQMVVDETVEWVQNHPDVAAQLQQLERFTFPGVWDR